MKVNVKKLDSNAVLPTYAKHGDAGMDLTATSKSYDEYGNVVYGTSLAFEIPDGYVGLLLPRSSNTKKDLVLGNSVGVIDSGYRGELVFKFKALDTKYLEDGRLTYTKKDFMTSYNVGERIGQIIIMPYPQIEFNLVDELSTTDRGVGGFGSTDAYEDALDNIEADKRMTQKRIRVDIADL